MFYNLMRPVNQKLKTYSSHDLGDINMVSEIVTSKTANFVILIIRPISEDEGFVYVIFHISARKIINIL